jgi:hypothetical protein
MRCALDPWDNAYYHLPLLLALLGWDAMAPSRLPLRGLAGAGFGLLFWQWSHNLSNIALFNLTYIAVAVTAGALIAVTLLRRTSPVPERRPAEIPHLGSGLTGRLGLQRR